MALSHVKIEKKKERDEMAIGNNKRETHGHEKQSQAAFRRYALVKDNKKCTN